MKTFCKLTAQSPAASYVPLPRFLLQDEALRDISNDAKVHAKGFLYTGRSLYPYHGILPQKLY